MNENGHGTVHQEVWYLIKILKNILICHKPAPTKQTVFSRENVNENYIDIGDNSMFNLKEGKTNEQSNLNPIGEEENSDDDKDDFYYYAKSIQHQSNSDSNSINIVMYERVDVEPTLVKKENYHANDQEDKKYHLLMFQWR